MAFSITQYQNLWDWRGFSAYIHYSLLQKKWNKRSSWYWLLNSKLSNNINFQIYNYIWKMCNFICLFIILHKQDKMGDIAWFKEWKPTNFQITIPKTDFYLREELELFEYPSKSSSSSHPRPHRPRHQHHLHHHHHELHDW